MLLPVLIGVRVLPLTEGSMSLTRAAYPPGGCC
jgi:hypothetical protein